MKKIVNVAAAVITRPDGQILLGQRAPDTFYAGYWEFPGGKVEAGETPQQALVRELEEELALDVQTAWPWLVREHLYEHAHVRLHFFEVPHWRGEPRGKVHSALSWQPADAVSVAPMLPANGPILKALRLPRRMGVTQAQALGIDAQLAAAERALASGLRLIQIREKTLDGATLRHFSHEMVARCRAAGAIAVINGDLALAALTGAHGVHLPAQVLMQCGARPDFEWVGASCHSRAELEQAARLGLDYAVLGAVKPTASHPGAAGMGWAQFAELSAALPLPILAIGGLDDQDMVAARRAGAHGIAMLRAAWRP